MRFGFRIFLLFTTNRNKKMLTLGVETSCDETSVAIVEDGIRALSNVILSQKEHSRFGGVVPEVASRSHVRAINPIFKEALDKAGCAIDDIDLVSATYGPGLVGCLLVGLSFAKGLAQGAGCKFVAVNHLEGHIASNFLTHTIANKPHIALIISGGHTALIHFRSFGRYELLGKTRDDAAGEAFDKVAKLIGLGYPGGAKIDKLSGSGDSKAFDFPRPMLKESSYEFSFSGLKTAVARSWKNLDDKTKAENLADVAASFQEAVVDVLSVKALRAVEISGVEALAVSGGVAANTRLRDVLREKCEKENIDLYFPETEFCTDNAAMIASAGYFRYQEFGETPFEIDARPSLSVSDSLGG